MIGVNLAVTQPNGVQTAFATIIDIRWQPMKSANLQIGFFVDSNSFKAGALPVWSQYVAVDITQIDPTLAIPPQLFAQLTAPGCLLYGGTPTS